MAFPEGLHDKKDQLLRPEVLQPKAAYDARELEAGPGITPDAPQLAPVHQPREDSLHLRQIELTSRNAYGLRSKSEELYPQAYFPVDTKFWEGLSAHQQAEVTRLQALAQEKVGYERGTQKYFMEDFDPRSVDKRSSGERLVEIETPRLVIAGAMLGAAATIGVALLLGRFSGIELLVAMILLIVIGSVTVAYGRN